MTRVLIVKILRDLRLPLLIVLLLICAFEVLWVKITQRLTQELLPQVLKSLSVEEYFALLKVFFAGPGQLVQTLIGGEQIEPAQPLHVLSIGYVHPLAQTILCIWAIGRASSAITGEIDRGTMELLLAQPLTRTQVVLAHFCVDLMVIPLMCLAMWTGSWLGLTLFGHSNPQAPAIIGKMEINARLFLPALANVAALLFAVGGLTLWLSARGRFRGRVLGVAILVALLQFLVNVIGQLWGAVAPLRPFTVFYYYQPQQIILHGRWSVDLAEVWHLPHPLRLNVLAVLVTVGLVGYGLALWTFRRRDLPAPL